MKNSLSNNTKTLDDILYQGLRPWLEQNSLDEKFASKLNAVSEYSSDFQFRYAINFHRPFDHKTKYYSKLILNTTKSDINRLIDLISEDKNDKLIKYWLDDTLTKRLKTRLKDVGKLINQKDFSLSYIDPKKTSFDIDRTHKANTYIIQLLKLSYIQLYLEIQDNFNNWIDDKMLPDDFYTQLLHEPIPDKHFITKVEVLEIEPKQKPKSKHIASSTVNSFHSFTYKQINKSPDKLNDLCSSLKKSKFISQNTSIQNFKKIFSGTVIKTPIVWTGNISELFYFIKLIHNDFKLIENLKQKQWEITCQCFIQEDGEQFERAKFRSLKKPNLTARAIEKAVEHIK
ncbi:MAG: hypothetical protein IM574_03975 [Cytophagales bacterium]|jgi:macrodomain Ter protein organizer (MatP/YcbG family)|nr:hypothetical protein [Cytophagales bacterium]MCA6390646.1 hypothetical protein [Cytophagales bacterium]MCA6403308.1 hypothetical protein [Cytophagales bacterium]MCA6407252.1 hypothetical protein [Cytophagales bacterium]MCA6411241.1 hypothetical protein [Cytophagales bacterium]